MSVPSCRLCAATVARRGSQHTAQPSAKVSSTGRFPQSMDDRLPVVSLFSGAGGLDLAVERCADGLDTHRHRPPLHVRVATDYDDLALATLQKNMPAAVTLCSD